MPDREAFFANISLEAEETDQEEISDDSNDGLPWRTFIQKTNA